jgi:hypothetical protein
MRRLLLLVCVVACDSRSSLVSPTSSCLVLNWSESSPRTFAPSSVMLDTTFDSRLPSTSNRYRLVKPVASSDSEHWSSIMMAWWLVRNDSLVLILRGVDAGRTIQLYGIGDSLSGSSFYEGTGGTYPVTARRFSCPEVRGAGA